MPTSSGPNTLGESNLVFTYDTGDTINSYRGEPTTNLIDPNTPNIYSWWTRNVQTITQLTETYKGQPIYRVSLSIDSGDMLYNITERWGGGSGWYMPYVMFNANTPYVASVIYRPVSHPDTRVYGHPSNIGGWGATVDGSTDIDNQWKIHRIDRNFGNTVGDNRFYHMYTPSATLGQTVTVDITNSQIEQKNHSTPFVNGTRSATQGLLPLIGNSTIDLSNVSFDSNAKMVFDGTDDYIGFGNVSGNIGGKSQATMELILKVNALQSNDYQQVFGFRNGSDFDFFMIIYPSENSGGTEFRARNSAGTFYDLNPNISAYIGKYLHVVFSVGPAGRQVYFNNVLVASNATWTGNFGPTSYFSIGNYLIGMAWSLEGDIPVAKLYDKQLTAQEIKQNYQQYKTRFNLS